MSDIKFLTVYDDENNLILNNTSFYWYKIAYLPVFYKYNNESYIDSVNTSSDEFINVQSHITTFGIDAGVFQHVYELTAEKGYKTLIVICPCRKFADYYKEALKAKKRYLRNCVINNESDCMNIHVFDSRTFGIAPIFIANTLARMYSASAMPEDLLLAYARRFITSSVSYVLTKGENLLGGGCDLRAYRITSQRIYPLDISDGNNEIKIDNFVRLVSKSISKAGGQFVASWGAECTFANNVIDKLTNESGLSANLTAQYSVPTANILGINSICIHFGDYLLF